MYYIQYPHISCMIYPHILIYPVLYILIYPVWYITYRSLRSVCCRYPGCLKQQLFIDDLSSVSYAGRVWRALFSAVMWCMLVSSHSFSWGFPLVWKHLSALHPEDPVTGKTLWCHHSQVSPKSSFQHLGWVIWQKINK